MDKNARFIAIVGLCLLGLCVMLTAVVVTDTIGIGTEDHLNAINKTLVGTNLTYDSIAGKPMNYTIGPGDVGSIEKTEYDGRPAWKVRVGQGMTWDVTMDDDGKQILGIKQIFQT